MYFIRPDYNKTKNQQELHKDIYTEGYTLSSVGLPSLLTQST